VQYWWQKVAGPMSDRPLAHIIYRVARMLVSLLEHEFGFKGKAETTE
jgi:hypothetical protein